MMFPIVADSGCFDVVLVDGKKRNFVELNRPYLDYLLLRGFGVN
jgi:hypothetical protein